MGLEDFIKKELDTEEGEKLSDEGIQKAGEFIEDKTGGKGVKFIDKGEEIADSRIGQ